MTSLVECGPGKVLSGLNKRCVKGVNTYNLDTPKPLPRLVTHWLEQGECYESAR